MASPNTTTIIDILSAPSPSPHPYYPTGVEIPHYIPNKNSVPYLLTTFFTTCALLLTATYTLSLRLNPKLTRTQLATILWFTLSGSIHLVFEGYYVLNFSSIAGSQHLIGQMWKEYALADSRYLTQSSLVLCMESITAVLWGPGCFLCAWMMTRAHEARWGLIGVVSLGQLYGDVLYYATSFFDHYVLDVSYSRPEAFYFWFYFVLMNAFWIVIPGALICQSIVETTRAVRIAQRTEQPKKS